MPDKGSTLMPRVVLVHGYLDDESSWADVAAGLQEAGFDTVTPRIGWEGEISLRAFAETVTRAALSSDHDEQPIVLVGHSMGAQVVELAASRLRNLVALVLLSPVPLGGLQLPDDVSGPLRGCGENPDIQRALRVQLSTNLSSDALERLVRIGSSLAKSRVEAWYDAWTSGDASAAEAPTPGVPTAVITADDAFVNDDLLALIGTRFTSAEFVRISGAGHWAHVENPASVTTAVIDFLAKLQGGDASSWTTAFEAKTQDSFAASLSADVELHASALYKPILGREAVAFTMHQASRIYDRLDFTSQASNDNLSFLEWTAHTSSGLDLAGVTVLEKDGEGLIRRVAIHHRPLGSALRFSKELRDRTTGVVQPDHFWDGREK